jgi:hypothetical protein
VYAASSHKFNQLQSLRDVGRAKGESAAPSEKIWSRASHYADARKNEGQSSLLVYKTRAANLSLCVHFFRNLFCCGETLLKVAVPLAERAGRRARVRLQSAGITPILIMIIESQHQQKAAATTPAAANAAPLCIPNIPHASRFYIQFHT